MIATFFNNETQVQFYKNHQQQRKQQKQGEKKIAAVNSVRVSFPSSFRKTKRKGITLEF